MWGKIYKLFFLMLLGLYLPANAAKSTLQLDFYSQKIQLAYYDEIKQLPAIRFTEDAPAYFARQMETKPYQQLVQSLLTQKDALQLNDWLYYLLVKETTEKLFLAYDANFRTMAQWFLLTKSGYRVKMLCNTNGANVFVHTKDMAFELPYIETNEGRFINISGHFDKTAHKLAKLVDSEVLYNPRGKSFSFTLNELPAMFKVKPVKKTLEFVHEDEKYMLEVSGDKSVIAFLRNYPKLELDDWARIPLSETAYNSFIPQFKELIAGKTQPEAVRMILSFTRNAFIYETDQQAYKEDNLIFSPEMTLLSPYSDCEDRAILFSYMVKELLGLKTVMLEYPTHVSAAVNLPTPFGRPIVFGGEKYTFCEPTGPQDDLTLGELPLKYAGKTFNIIATE